MSEFHFLYISYFLPPLGRAESRHNVAWLRELTDQGWTAEVLTASSDEDYPMDETLLDFLPESGAKMHPVLCRPDGGRIMRYLKYRSGLLDMVPLGNCSKYVEHALELHADEPFDFIYSVYGIPLAHEIAWNVRQETGLPWVAEFRDPLIHNHILKKLLDSRSWPIWRAHQRKKMESFEGRVVRQADLVVVESPLHDEQIVDDYGVAAEKVLPLGVGYDSRQFPEEMQAEYEPDIAVRIGYIGSLYEGYEQLTEYIVAGLAQLSCKFELIVVGDDRGVFRDLAGRYELTQFQDIGRVSQVEALRIMESLDIGLIMIDEDYELINSKFWEYLYAGLSIVALAPSSGAMARWMEDHHAGYVLPYDAEGISEMLRTVAADVESGKLRRSDLALIEEYDAPRVVGKIASSIRQIVLDRRET